MSLHVLLVDPYRTNPHLLAPDFAMPSVGDNLGVVYNADCLVSGAVSSKELCISTADNSLVVIADVQEPLFLQRLVCTRYFFNRYHGSGRVL